MEERLSPEGAQRLRAVRNMFIRSPELYCYHWTSECGTKGCIGGWLARNRVVREGIGEFEHDQHCEMAVADLGFTPQAVFSFSASPLAELFYDHHTPKEAIERINEFLWIYGYPPDEIVEVEEPSLVACC